MSLTTGHKGNKRLFLIILLQTRLRYLYGFIDLMLNNRVSSMGSESIDHHGTSVSPCHAAKKKTERKFKSLKGIISRVGFFGDFGEKIGQQINKKKAILR